MSTSSIANSMMEVPNEDIPPEKIKNLYDLRLKKKTYRVVYGAGLCLTGSLAAPHLVKASGSPDIVSIKFKNLIF